MFAQDLSSIDTYRRTEIFNTKYQSIISNERDEQTFSKKYIYFNVKTTFSIKTHLFLNFPKNLNFSNLSPNLLNTAI